MSETKLEKSKNIIDNKLSKNSYTYKKVIEDLKKDNLLEEFGWEENIEVYKLWSWVYEVYANDTKNIQHFCNKEWETILSIWSVIKDKYFKEALILSWLYFAKEKDSPTDHLHILKYNWKEVYYLDAKTLLKLVEQVQDNKDKKERLKWLEKWKEIDKFSYEYFKAWKNISFYEERLYLHLVKNSVIVHKEDDWTGFFDKWWKSSLDYDLDDWFLLIKDIEFFANYQMLSKDKDKNKNEELKKYYIKKIVKDLFLKQIMDERFIKTQDQITKEQVEEYYKKWYLPEKIYKQAIKILEEIEKADTKLEEQKEKEQKKEISPQAKKLREFFKSVGVDIE